MAPPFIFALLGLLSASLALAGPVALDAATLLLNGQQALVLNCQFQSLQNGSSCTRTCCVRLPLIHNADWVM
jgi:hypothetical protein